MNSTEILAQKSRELLNDQLNVFDSNNSKAGTFISISALFVPITFTVFEKFSTNSAWIILFFIPIVLNLFGIYFLIKSLYPKSVYHGINFLEFDRLIEKTPEEIYLFEIGVNRDSFKDNATVLRKQNKYLKLGLQTIFTSAVFLFLIFFINLTSNNFHKMADNTQNTTSSSNNQNQDSSGNSSDSGRKIPTTDPGQRSTIEKGGNTGDIQKK